MDANGNGNVTGHQLDGGRRACHGLGHEEHEPGEDLQHYGEVRAAIRNLDVQSSYMENTMSQTTTTAVPQSDVDNLLTQVADEAG